MTPNQFWNGDVWLTADYYRASQLAAQRKSEEMWLQGLYIYNAVAVAVGNVLRKKGTKAAKYIEKPIRIIPYTEEEKKAKAEEERRRLVLYLDGFKKSFEAKKRKKKG